MKKLYALFLLLILSYQCTSPSKKTTPTKEVTTSTIKYANGFDIRIENGEKKLIVKRVFQKGNKTTTYTLGATTDIEGNSLQVPVENIVVTSTSHIPMLELLQAEKRIVGFPNTRYISSEKTRQRIAAGLIVDLGSERSMNTEKLLELNPALVVGFSLHPNNKLYENIKKAGIPVLYNGEWLEETPLGRAEWLKFFGVLLGKEKEADSIFNHIEQEYLNAKKLAQNAQHKPTVLSGSLYKDVWNVPAGNSYTARFFKDANLDYLWSDTSGTGSLQLGFESVLEKGQHATYWIKCGSYGTKEQMLTANKNYAEFDAFKQNKLYSIGVHRGPTGGIIYYEQSPVRPDLVLKDLVKITQPEILPDYELHFFSPLQ